MEDKITPEYVKSLTDFSPTFLCEPRDNKYKLKFLNFKVRDSDSGETLFEVADESGESNSASNEDNNEADETSRTIRYHLGPEFLSLNNIGSSLTFSVGPLPVKNLLMIERHYFKGKLIKSFEFKFDFCIPNSVNTWESIYVMPELAEEVMKEMVKSPWETKSDSFYFVENKLIMHHKALYDYSPFEDISGQ